MKSSLVVFGVIFLVIGILLYFMPMQELKADTITSGNGVVDLRTSSARITVPVEWAYASMIIGFALLVFGFVIPNPIVQRAKDHSHEKVAISKEMFDGDNIGKRTIVRERTETH